jgi:hypothetical protein
MDLLSSETEGLIYLKEFVTARLPLIREDYFLRGKNVAQSIKSDMISDSLPEVAIERLIDICK